MKLFARLKSYEAHLERGPKIKIVQLLLWIFLFSSGVGFLTSLGMSWIKKEQQENMQEKIAYEEAERLQSLIDALKQERYANN